MPALPSANTLGAALQTQIATDTRGARSLESFGATAVDYDQTPTDNRAAFLSAIDWCANTGGEVIIGAGLYGVDGDLPLKSYANFRGLGRDHSRVVQIAASATDTFTSSAAADESIAFCRFMDFAIYGGWTSDSAGWNEDKSTGHNFACLRLIGSSDGPDDPIAFAREGVSFIADPYHVISGMHLGDVAGYGLYTDGRGEFNVFANRIDGCSMNGMHFLAPDCFLGFNSVKRVGNNAVYMTGGNQRVVNEKYWFTGMSRDAERVGAGLQIDGSGVANEQLRITTQDTWGPGLVVDGDAPDIIVQIDEAGGGRVEQQGFGWAGARTENRSCIRVAGAMRHGKIRGSVRGGGRVGVGNEPCLVDFSSSGCYGNRFDFVQEGAELNSTLIQTSTGYDNNKRHNIVTLNEQLLHGAVTPAELADAAHGINVTSLLPEVTVDDGAGVVDKAVRQGDGSWRLLYAGTTTTPV